ncbi:glycosyltransferase family 4 protein [Zobellia barbeyronii]|uniref:Glycosyltransferase family 4 protein n=1 Tax=Zobellia barbeyronii TaxID=2748009 RepID=A0ABS5WBE4_9FLAO|nr:glycosyltransferase family 4 protein [Zobellia barbeyronii]MBT2160710.1 glycosyltransferase family 4 protein [Zobellia barbeyronii]
MKKVLIITYYWPPAGGPGVQRWLKFVKYLRDFNIEPVLYIPENPHYPIEDASLLSEIPKGITIYSKPLFEPYGLAKLVSSKKTKRISSGIIQTKNQSFFEKGMLWIRGNFFIPDARKYWIKPSVKFLTEVISKDNIDTVITTGPPHSVHLIGRELKKDKGVTWFADFRDPWTSIGYHKELKLTSNSAKKHKELEHAVLNEADRILVTSNTTKTEFEDITKQPISVITNGYDSDYEGDANLDERFTISHIGSLLTGRNPKNLWKVLSQIAAENSVFRGDLQLEFMGVVSQDVMDSMYRYELGPYIKMLGYGSHAEAQRKQQRSQLLLLVEIDSEETKGIIPGKLFEYMIAKRPILAVGPKEWEAGQIIESTNAGEVFDYEAQAELKKTILEWYEVFKKGKITSESVAIEKYSRRALTEELSKLL